MPNLTFVQGKKGVWIKLPLERVNLVEAAVKIAYDILGRSEMQEGFWYHHAEPDYLMLAYWIPQSPRTLPTNATHCVGIGAFLINQNRESTIFGRMMCYLQCLRPVTTFIVFHDPPGMAKAFVFIKFPQWVLVVQEKGGQYRGTGVWKLPAGVVDEGKDIFAAAVQEVKEETGSHKSFFEKSDLFFLCKPRPISFDIQKQEQEIEAAEWMPYEEYAAQPFVQKYELLKYMHDICKAKIDGKYSGFSPLPSRNYALQKSYLYVNSSKAPKRESKL